MTKPTKWVGWLCWGLTSQSTIFQSCRDGAIASWVINQYFRGVKCLAQGHNTAAVGLEPRTSRSGVRHSTTEPPRSPNKMSVHPAKTQISLSICPVWSESLLSAWRNLVPLATHWAHSEDYDQTGRMPRLIWVLAGGTLIWLSCRGSYVFLLLNDIYEWHVNVWLYKMRVRNKEIFWTFFTFLSDLQVLLPTSLCK